MNSAKVGIMNEQSVRITTPLSQSPNVKRVGRAHMIGLISWESSGRRAPEHACAICRSPITPLARVGDDYVRTRGKASGARFHTAQAERSRIDWNEVLADAAFVPGPRDGPLNRGKGPITGVVSKSHTCPSRKSLRLGLAVGSDDAEAGHSPNHPCKMTVRCGEYRQGWITERTIDLPTNIQRILSRHDHNIRHARLPFTWPACSLRYWRF